MNLDAINALEFHTGALEQAQQRAYREITEMLVVDGVVFKALEHFGQVGRFNNYAPGRFQQRGASCQEIRSGIDVGENVICQHCAGRAVLFDDSRRQRRIEKLIDGIDARLARESGYICGRLHAKGAHTAFAERAQQAAIVRSDLHDQVFCAQPELAHNALRECVVMPDDRCVGAGAIKIIGK